MSGFVDISTLFRSQKPDICCIPLHLLQPSQARSLCGDSDCFSDIVDRVAGPEPERPISFLCVFLPDPDP